MFEVLEIQKRLEKLNYPSSLPISKEIYNFSKGNRKNIEKILKRISQNEPWEYIRGYTYFHKNKIFVNKDVLIPRIETEQLAQIAIKQIKKLNNPQIFDIGTGSGCIAITLSKKFPKSNIFATDISNKAIKVAKKNIKENHCKNINLINTNLLDFKFNNKKPTVIIANLPYLPSKQIKILNPSVKKYEPTLALDGGKKGFEIYKKLLVQIKEKKINLHYAIFEIDSLIEQFFQKRNCKIIKDSFNKNRFVIIHPVHLK
jgi:release factor glutamine methyltransferase